MTTTGIDPAGIFADARHMHGEALGRLAAGDIRDAADKAWCATLRATEALILARTGQPPHTSTSAGRRLRLAAQTDTALLDIRNRYLVRQSILHGECFYHGYCEPVETESLIRETETYIQDAQRLAALPWRPPFALSLSKGHSQVPSPAHGEEPAPYWIRG